MEHAEWTEDRIRSYGVRMPGIDAVEAVYGAKRTKAYQMLRRGDVDFRVLPKGRSYVVPTVDVLRLLGLDRPADRELVAAPGGDAA